MNTVGGAQPASQITVSGATVYQLIPNPSNQQDIPITFPDNYEELALYEAFLAGINVLATPVICSGTDWREFMTKMGYHVPELQTLMNSSSTAAARSAAATAAPRALGGFMDFLSKIAPITGLLTGQPELGMLGGELAKQLSEAKAAAAAAARSAAQAVSAAATRYSAAAQSAAATGIAKAKSAASTLRANLELYDPSQTRHRGRQYVDQTDSEESYGRRSPEIYAKARSASKAAAKAETYLVLRDNGDKKGIRAENIKSRQTLKAGDKELIDVPVVYGKGYAAPRLLKTKGERGRREVRQDDQPVQGDQGEVKKK